MAHRRVVITGLGIVAPNGIGKDEFWRNLIEGLSAVSRIFGRRGVRLEGRTARMKVRDVRFK